MLEPGENSMANAQGRTGKSISARIKICRTGKNVDDALRTLVDEWLVPGLIDSFFKQCGMAEAFSERTDEKLLIDMEEGNCVEDQKVDLPQKTHGKN